MNPAACSAAVCAALATCFWPASAAAGCDIYVTVKNSTSADIYIQRSNFKVKAKGGSWRRLASGGWFDGVGANRGLSIPPGGRYNRRYRASFGGCKTRRRFRLGYGCTSISDNRVEYLPSPTGWVRATNLQINVTRPC